MRSDDIEREYSAYKGAVNKGRLRETEEGREIGASAAFDLGLNRRKPGQGNIYVVEARSVVIRAISTQAPPLA